MAALLSPNALASLCLRNLAHLGRPSPKPTYPWNLLPPSLHSPMRAASGHTPTPLPGIAVARPPGVRYPASLGFGGWNGAVWDKDPGKGQGRALELFSYSFHKAVSPLGLRETVLQAIFPFAFCGQWKKWITILPNSAREHQIPTNIIKPKEMEWHLPQCHSSPSCPCAYLRAQSPCALVLLLPYSCQVS